MKAFPSFSSFSRRSCLGFAALLVSASFGWGAPVRHPALRPVPNCAVEPLATDALRPVEQSFLEKALESCQQQIRLADIGASQGSSAAVRSHAAQLAADYRELNESLQALVNRKGGIAGAPTGGTSENFQKLSTRSGNDFDREFVRLASQMSDSVMNLFEQAANTVKDTEVREFATGELPLLRGHSNRGVELKQTVE